MGGCKCTFRSCPVSTQYYPEMHFFHYPLKKGENERLFKWIKYADNQKFLDLRPSQAQNKNICALHFRTECFMNYKRNRLIPTAVPTLDRLPNGQVLDYTISDNPKPITLPPTTEKHLIPPSDYRVFGMSEKRLNSISTIPNYGKSLINTILKRKTQEQSELQAEVTKEPIKKPKLLNSSFKIISNESIAVTEVKKAILENGHSGPEDTYEHENSSDNLNEEHIEDEEKLEEVGESSNNEVVTKDYFIEICNEYTNQVNELKLEMKSKQDVANAKIAQLENELLEAKQNAEMIQYKLNKTEILANNLKKQLEESKAEFLQSIKGIKILSETEKSVEKPTVAASTPMTKPQLFNGIKKYLSTSMTALIRMEMFAGAERVWKPDEKQVSIELLQIGENVYKYFCDEWRLRLPPIKDVKQWMNEGAEEDEEDL